MEASLVERAGVRFVSVPAAGLHGVGLRALPRNLWQLTRGVVAARRILKDFRPQALLLTGGFVGVPVSVAARGIPKLVYVPDIEPGQALRLMARFADCLAVTAAETLSRMPRRRRVCIAGYPTRPALRRVDQARARATFGLTSELPVVLVFGGSKGARSINDAVWDSLEELLSLAQIVHVTGSLDWPRTEARRQGLPADLARRYHPFAYLHDEMADALAAAELAVARAGASTLGELPLFGLPAVLVPYPHAWRYQQVNAEYLAARGGAVRLADDDLAGKLVPLIRRLLADPARLEQMREAMRRMARPQAAAEIAAELERLLDEGGRRG
jgi:UDP-N-acetylglucosamine--N-acetylmuramyl-(pentapeptide) pyrophosphoryl-undecaprenol N-acetylglucosamine transferase